MIRRSIFDDARGNAPIAQAFDRDLGFLARNLPNPGTAGDAAVDFEPQCLGGGSAVGGDGDVDEIGHSDLTISDLLQPRARFASAAMPPFRNSIAPD
jgi:hypothetical protein